VKLLEAGLLIKPTQQRFSLELDTDTLVPRVDAHALTQHGRSPFQWSRSKVSHVDVNPELP